MKGKKKNGIGVNGWQLLYDLQRRPSDTRSKINTDKKKSAIAKLLVEVGLLNKQYKFTDRGKAAAQQIFNRMKELSAGVPLKDRKKIDPVVALTSGRWHKGKVELTTGDKYWIVSNDRLGIVAESTKELPDIDVLEKMDKKQKENGAFYLEALATTKGWIQIKAYALQASDKIHQQWIWFRDSKKIKRTVLQAKYYDFIKAQWPNAKLFYHTGMCPWSPTDYYPVIIKDENDKIVAFVAPGDVGRFPPMAHEKKQEPKA